MSSVKTLGRSVVAWAVLGIASVQADSMSKSKADRLWTMAWSAEAINSYQGPSAAAASPPAPAPVNPAPVLTLTPAPAPAPTPAMNPLFASAPGDPTIAAPAPIVPMSAPISQPVFGVQTVSAAPMIAGAPSAAAPVDAFINMTTGPFPASGALSTGNAQPWYDSPSVIQAFGGVPNAQQQSSFEQSVLQDVQHTYQISGMNPTLTMDPNAPALHTLSVVSGVTDPSNPNEIGLTNVGGNGLSFIDKLSYASNPTDLAWAVAHNISHELMHAFGVGYHPDGGNFVDAPSATWSTLTDPNAQFGPQATQLLLSSQYGTLSSATASSVAGGEVLNPGGTVSDGEEMVATPEPATMAMWALGALGGMMMLRRRAARLAS